MRAVVVYDSIYGNTERTAKSIGDSISSGSTVIRADKADYSLMGEFDLIIIGSPTHAGRPTKSVQDFLTLAFLGTGLAALGGWGSAAVLSRKAYAIAHAAGQHPDRGTTGYQRIIGGAIALGMLLLMVKWRSARTHGGILEAKSLHISRDKWRRLWPWVAATVAGQTIGVTCMQWALENTSAGIVTAIIATTPILLLPMTRFMDGERIGVRSTLGALTAVAGVVGLVR